MKVEQQKDSKQKKIVQIEDLSVSFDGMEVVKHVNIEVNSGEIVGIVGESGSGKSITSLTLMGLLSKQAQVTSGKIIVDGEVLREADRPFDERLYRRFQGSRMSMIFQEPMTSLNPVFTVGEQIAESIRLHQNASREEAMVEAKRMLDQVRIPEAQTILSRYPHQLSGGMRQRVMIAMALACEPKLLIADEPTTALDVKIQEQILHLIRKLNEKMGMSVLFITHDMGAVSQLCHSVKVMYLGQIVEDAVTEELFSNPLHPYTKGLLSCIPHLGVERDVELSTIHGAVPSISQIPDGCHFCTRCRYADKKCERQQPPLIEVTSGHFVKCWKYIDKGNAESEE